MNLTLTKKIIAGAIASIVAVAISGSIISYNVLHKQGADLALEKMRAMVAQAETVRSSMSDLANGQAFDYAKLKQELESADDFRKTALYGTIPIVAAWKSLEDVSSKDGLRFRIPKVNPRNPRNTPTEDELAILTQLKTEDAEEYFHVDRSAGVMVYAKPIRLDQGCLVCHGDPATSPTSDGNDLLGFSMENWKAGEIHGAFVLESSLESVNAAVASSMWNTAIWLIPVGGGICIALYLLVRRAIIKPIDSVIDEISEASAATLATASEVSQSSLSLAKGANEQASSLEETSATLVEIESMTEKNVEHAVDATRVSELASLAANEGSQGMEKMLTAMSQIKESSAHISDIIKTIDEIAFQTNILALNAAVEAARAGEAGAGFAVVADEVRSLAQRSANAARETAEKIEDSVAKSEDGVRVSQEVGESLTRIAKRVDELNTIIANVSGSSSEQSQGINQINRAVNEMERVTQEAAASTEELASASEQASSQAHTLENAVDKLRAVVNGDRARRSLNAQPSPMPIVHANRLSETRDLVLN